MKSSRRNVVVVTGSRAEFGLLASVMRAIKKHKRLRLHVVVSGEHLLPPALTWREVAREFPIAAKVPMQKQRDRGRLDHAAAAARGMEGFARAFRRLKPDWVVVLGDRIEAFAAASAASIAGIAVAHIHGGDRAEGIADEAMRHAITKLSHLHLAATKQSAQRIVRMGERPEHVHVTGSPAIDGLDRIKPMSDREATRLGDPNVLIIMHPSGLTPGLENTFAHLAVMSGALQHPAPRPLAFLPNSDPGREEIVRVLRMHEQDLAVRVIGHMQREKFVALLKRVARQRDGMLIGNSSAGLIESAAVGLRTLNLGQRQAGREHGRNVVNVPDRSAVDTRRAILALLGRIPDRTHPFGDGRAGPRIAAILARVDPHSPALLRKRNTY